MRAGIAADPAAKVVLGGIATETSFLETLFEWERIAPAVDVANLHSYFETWHPDPIERLPEYVVRVEGGGGERAVVLSLRGDEVLLARVAP